MKEREIAPQEDDRVIAYRRYIMQDIISRPQDMWITQTRIHFLAVKENINETFAIGPWLDSMIRLKDELARMGKVDAQA